MGEKWDIEEGVLRGKRQADGSWEFYQEVAIDTNSDPEIFRLDAATPLEARRSASATEQRKLDRYERERRHHHTTTSFNQSGWVGDILDKPPAKYLIDEFEIDVQNLTAEQRTQLEFDVLSLDHSFLTKAKQDAKRDLKTTRDALAQLEKQKSRLEQLSRGFRSMNNFSRDASPEVTLARLMFELSENEKAIGQTLDELGRDKSNISAVSLCDNAIDVFLRWGDKEMPDENRGIAYSPRSADLAKLPKVEGIEIHDAAKFQGPLGEYLEDIQSQVLKAGNEVWNFSVHEPARIALRDFEYSQRFKGQQSYYQF